MNYPFSLPHAIKNPFGDELIFEALENENGVKKMMVRNRVMPGSGTPFHVHFKQDEGLTVSSGTIGYQIDGETEKVAKEGESIVFKKGQMHRFWNAGEEVMECIGWVKPANSLDYYLTGIYNSMNKTGTAEGDPFESAYLMRRYKSEYDFKDIPIIVKKVVFPLTVAIGRLLGKYKHFEHAPTPIK